MLLRARAHSPGSARTEAVGLLRPDHGAARTRPAPDPRIVPLRGLKRLIQYLEARPPTPGTMVRASSLACVLYRRLFQAETGLDPETSDLTSLAALVFRSTSGVATDREAVRAQAALFLHYAPIAVAVVEPDGTGSDIPHRLMLWDALRLLLDHNRLHRQGDFADAYGPIPQVPFAQTFQRARRTTSVQSHDVNVGAAILSLAIESRMRTDAASGSSMGKGLPAPMWKLFSDLAARDGLSVELGVMVTIYNWAISHRRVGCRSFLWLNYFANDLLEPFFAASLGAAFAEDRRDSMTSEPVF